MKFPKFKHLLFAAVATIGFAASAKTVYLKPLGADETRETQDGASWATAYATIAAAISGTEAGDDLYLAQGIYQPEDTMKISKSLSLYGGFAGVSMDETLADRKVDEYQTIVCAYINKTTKSYSDRKWEKWTPKLDGLGVTTSSTSEPMIKDGKWNPPPAFADDDLYSAYVTPNISDKYTIATWGGRAFTATSGTVIFDGLYITGCENHSYASDDGGIAIGFYGASGGIYNCRLYGNQTAHGIVYAKGSPTVTVKDTIIAYNRGSAANTVLLSGYNLRVENCMLHSNVRSSSGRNSFVINGRGGNHPGLFGCEITRNIDVGSGAGGSWGGGLLISGQYNNIGAIGGCNVHHNYMSDSSTDGYSLVGRCNGDTVFTNNLFVANRVHVKAANNGYYTLFGQRNIDVNRTYRYENCLFKDNVLSVPSVADDCTGYVLSTIGSSCAAGKTLKYNVIGCAFDSNGFEPNATVAPTLVARGVLVYGNPNDNTPSPELTVENCTFVGPTAANACEIAQVGKHTKTAKIVNSLFLTTDENGVANAVSAVQPNLVSMASCTVQNQTVAPADFAACTLYAYDKVPLVEVANGQGWKEPAAKPDSLLGTSATTMKEDWFGNAPAEGGFIRGAVQQMTPAAATGATLVLRREPFAAGTFTQGPAVQAVADATTPIVPVTATSADAGVFNFIGWYEGETLVSDLATLSGLTLSANRTLVAKFDTPKVTVTVDLGEHAKFKDDGKSVHELKLDFGAAFAVPATDTFVADEGYTFCGWKETPPTTVTEPFTLHADVVANFRTVTIGPEDDLAATIAEIGKTAGEVRMKGGLYVPPARVDLRPNVSLKGGVDGAETVVSNKIAKGFFYYDFDTECGLVEIDGITFKGFTEASVDMSASRASTLVVTNCTFDKTAPLMADELTLTVSDCLFTNNTGVSVSLKATQTTASTSFATAVVERCVFSGNSGTQVEIYGQRWARILGCPFAGNTGRAIRNGWAYNYLGGSLDVEDCEFTGNVYNGTSLYSSYHNNASATRRDQFRRCFVHDNEGRIALSGSASALLFQIGATDEHAGFVLCDSTFARNRMTVPASSTNEFAALVICNTGWRSFVINCSVYDNEIVADGKTTKPYGYSLFYQGGLTRGQGFVNTIVSGTKVTGLFATNFTETASLGCQPYAVNTVFANAAAGYRSVRAENAFAVHHSETNAAAAVSAVKRVKNAAETVPEMLTVRKGTPYAKASCRVWLEYATTPSGYTQVWFYDPDKSGDKKWAQLNKPSSMAPYTDWYATNTTYTLSSPVMPDAWGNARSLDRKALGPLPAAKAGLVIMLQ